MKRIYGAVALIALLAITTSCGHQRVGNDQLVIGLECNYAPFNWTEKNSNEYTLPISNQKGMYADGYDIQIAKYLSEELNKPVKIVQTVWESLITDLQFGTINAVIAGMTDTPQRREEISFTDEYYRSELVLITKKEVADLYNDPISITNFSDFISGKSVVSQVSTVTDEVIDTFATYGAIHLTPLSTFALCATDVSMGAAFAMTAELPVALSLTTSFSSLGIVHIDQNILGEAQADLGVSIGIAKGNTELQEEINAALAKLSLDQRVEMMGGAISRSPSGE